MTETALLSHQVECVDKLKRYPAIGIFDDMGVGKTVEAIEVDRIRRKTEWPNPKTLVVTLAGPIVEHWQEHFNLWYPEMSVITIDPKNRNGSWNQFVNTNADVLIVHWDAIRLMPQLTTITWLHIIADEVHRIMHRNTVMTKSFKKIKTGFKTGLSGTPTTGAPHLLWSVLNWLYPKKYTSYHKFFDKYIIWEMDPQGQYKKIIGVNTYNIQELIDEIEPFTIRRLLREVRPDMPERMPPETYFVNMLPLQARAYGEMKEDMVAWVERKSAESGADEILDPIVAQAAISRLTRLQQFSKAYAHLETVTRTRLNKKTGEYEDVTETKVRLSEPSSTLDMAMIKINEVVETGNKIVVFSDFRQLIELLNVRLEAAGISYATITGSVKREDRLEAVRAFQHGDAMVCSVTRAGGTGIDLYAGSRILFLSWDWSPAIVDQAIGRIDRIGQTQPIQVMNIQTRGTVDMEKVDTVNLKWSWMRMVLRK